MRKLPPQRQYFDPARLLRRLAALLLVGMALAACDTPLGPAPASMGEYWKNAIVTNPDGNGPQVVRWGPPQNYNPEQLN